MARKRQENYLGYATEMAALSLERISHWKSSIHKRGLDIHRRGYVCGMTDLAHGYLDLMGHFLKEAERSGGLVGYQTLINDALRQHMEGKAPKLEETLRRSLREEIKAAG